MSVSTLLILSAALITGAVAGALSAEWRIRAWLGKAATKPRPVVKPELRTDPFHTHSMSSPLVTDDDPMEPEDIKEAEKRKGRKRGFYS